MIELITSPEVLLRLRQEFPKPEKSAERALSKYVAALEALLFNAYNRGIPAVQKKMGIYSIPLHTLANKGGRIGPNKIRLHSWLRENGLQLVETVEKGSKFSGVYSTVKLTNLVTLKDAMTVTTFDVEKNKTNRELHEYLVGKQSEAEAVFKYLLPELTETPNPGEIRETFDYVPIDLESLKAFIVWLSNGASFGTKDKLNKIMNQARLIYSVASLNGSLLPQRIKLSPFGRTYYDGISVQNVHKELRRAMLGNCWEYDIRSSVVAWKMGFAFELLTQAKLPPNTRSNFPATTLFLEDKSDFMATVRHFTFVQNENLSRALQTSLIKRALTAISFGAKSRGSGWIDIKGVWKNPALVDIFKNKDERERFLSDATVKAFIFEQQVLDEFIFSQAQKKLVDEWSFSILQTKSGKLSKSKVLAFLYQHAETQAMDFICNFALLHGHKPIARVHDAVFFKSRLGPDLKQDLEFKLQEATGNKFWHLSPKMIERYTPISIDAARAEIEHKQFIAAEESRASMYFITQECLEKTTPPI